MESNLIVTSSPHVRDNSSSRRVMLDVIIALAPALVASVWVFGPRSLLLVAVSILSCVAFEFLFNLVTKKEQTIDDLSAVVTGMLLAFNLPATLPVYMVIIGAFAAIVVTKMIFGGVGRNFANPALVGRIVLFLSFARQMGNWVEPGAWMRGSTSTGATPLITGSAPYLDLFLGNVGGCIGETSALALLIGLVYLCARKIIFPTAPLVFIGTVFIFTFALGQDPVYQILSGGLFLGAIFMATDYATTPFTQWGRVVFGLGCGVITVMIRSFGSYPEGVSFAIILMNLLTPWIERWTRPEQFGSNTPYKIRRICLYIFLALFCVIMIVVWIMTTFFAVVEDEFATAEELTEALGDEYERIPLETDNEQVLSVYSGSGVTGIITSAKGYQSTIRVLVTIDDSGAVVEVFTLSNRDTAGFGQRIVEEPEFLAQFPGATDTGGIDVLADATITAEAYIEAVQVALDQYAGM